MQDNIADDNLRNKVFDKFKFSAKKVSIKEKTQEILGAPGIPGKPGKPGEPGKTKKGIVAKCLEHQTKLANEERADESMVIKALEKVDFKLLGKLFK